MTTDTLDEHTMNARLTQYEYHTLIDVLRAIARRERSGNPVRATELEARANDLAHAPHGGRA